MKCDLINHSMKLKVNLENKSLRDEVLSYDLKSIFKAGRLGKTRYVVESLSNILLKIKAFELIMLDENVVIENYCKFSCKYMYIQDIRSIINHCTIRVSIQ